MSTTVHQAIDSLPMPTLPPAELTAGKTTRNVLTTSQIVKLWNWCEKNKANLPTLPNTQLAQIAGAELQFPITPANIANMLAEMHIEKRKPDAPPTVEERLDTLRIQSEAHENILNRHRTRLDRIESILIDARLTQPLTPGEAFITGYPLPPQPPADHPELPITTGTPVLS